MVSTAAVPQAEVLLQEVIVGSGIKFAQIVLQTWLTKSRRQARVMGFYGMDGIGKTSLLKLIRNNNKKVSGIIFEVVIWFTVSMHKNEEHNKPRRKSHC